MQWDLTRLALQAAWRTWRPKSLQDRGRNPKKAMLKHNIFLASIFKGFGPRFGRAFGRFFEPKMQARATTLAKTFFESKPQKSCSRRGETLISKTLRSAQSEKVAEKSRKSRLFSGASILNGFWAGLGRALDCRNLQFFCFLRPFFDAKF